MKAPALLFCVLASCIVPSFTASGTVPMAGPHHGLLSQRDEETCSQTSKSLAQLATCLRKYMRPSNSSYALPTTAESAQLERAAAAMLQGKAAPCAGARASNSSLPLPAGMQLMLFQEQQSTGGAGAAAKRNYCILLERSLDSAGFFARGGCRMLQ